jgi:hypothetical protein
MKKLLFALPVVLLLAAGCSSNQPVVENQPNNTQPTQNQQTTPSPTNTQATPPTQQTTPPANTQTQPTPTPTQTASTKTYSNKDYGFSVKYPSDFTLKTTGANGLTLPEGTVNYLDRFGLEVALLSLPKSALPSGVIRADVLISINNTVSGGNYSFSAVDKNQGVPPPVIDTLTLNNTLTISSIKYGVALKDGAAAGTQSHVKVYHVNHNNMWYEIQLNLWTSSDGNGKQPDTEPVWQKLESILTGFQFTK